MAIWLVRAGSGGEHENYALDKKVCLIGWESLGDLSETKTREYLLNQLEEAYPDVKSRARSSWRGQIWSFINSIQTNDYVAMPLKHRPVIAFGKVTGKYKFDLTSPHDAKHQLPVKWICEVPRSNISQDLLYSLGAFLTVCKMTRNDAETRLTAIINGEPDPVFGSIKTPTIADEADEDIEVDFEALAREKVRQLISAQFKGHGLAKLVGAILAAQGYQVVVSPEGADGGVDIIAGTGALGFDSPRLIAQVKSDQGAIDVKVVRELQGVMKQFGAHHGLVVAWGGFKGSVIKEMARQYFEIRLWTGDDVVANVLEHYDKLPADIRAELPLKRMWTVALTES
jgi:restriction system protein